jgi:hypothetical protein
MGPPGTAGLAAEKLLSKKFACENCSYKGALQSGLRGISHRGTTGALIGESPVTARVQNPA